jgi:hypothetical protein
MSVFEGLDDDDGTSNPFSTHAEIGTNMLDESSRQPVEDVDRAPTPGEPPVPGAQWDELHRRWELWDEGTEEWVVVGDDPGEGVAPSDENLLPPTLARELLHADEVEARPHLTIDDVDRSSPQGPAPRGAQWNEIVGRWERWDEATDSWVEAKAEPDA